MTHPLVKLVYIIIGLAGLYYIFPFLVPFLIALVLAVIVEPVVEKLGKILKVRRLVAVTINYLVFLAALGGFVFLASTRLIREIGALIQQAPMLVQRAGQGVADLILHTQNIFEDLPTQYIRELEEATRNAVNMGSKISTGAEAVLGTARAIPEIFVVVIVTLVSFYLMSLQLPDLKKSFLTLFTDRAVEKVLLILMDVNKAVIGFVRAQFIISFITYIFILTGLLILGFKYALAIALLIVLVDVLPILGTGFIMLPWAAMLVLINERNAGIGIIFLYILIIVLRRIIEPKILGENIGLTPLTTVISMYIGYKVAGIGGLFLGPAVCIVFKAMRKSGLFGYRLDF